MTHLFVNISRNTQNLRWCDPVLSRVSSKMVY
ncbi:hypothetical protein T01_1319 [Trichinella spiralis]|uniref:Uncharacterized protein n=1 Tax=Trichinella spiralis TaxID=6334 RepID=A0A0V1AM87_TRISP|nr:hypothetical protein T01_1319 [Trichinella spiralis]